VNKMAKKKVNDDEVENVGIMAGFMDDIEELMEEIAEAEMSGGEDQDMAKLMDRRPDSPEVLMNNLRGDYRSIDARREELADLVGMSAAVETPDDVLALLQPVLAQQGIEALTPSSSLPFGTMAPAAAMPPPPMDMAAAGLPAPPVEPGGVGSLPMGMAEGGIVQNFQKGSVEPTGFDPGGVTPMTFSPEVIQAAQSSIADVLAQQPAAVPDLAARTKALTPEYAEILGLGDKDAIRAQMLFDIGQAALGFAGNVGPQGQALRGSTAARLAQATSALPGQIGARAAQIRKEEQAATGAALQAAQAEQSAAMAANARLSERQQDLLGEIAKQKSFRLLTMEEKNTLAANNPAIDVDLPWQIDQAGEISIAGGRPPAPLVDMSGDTLGKAGAETASQAVSDSFNNATKAVQDIRKIDDTIKLLQEGDVDTGFGAEFRQNLRRVVSLFSNDPERIATLSDTELLNSAIGQEVFGAINSLGIGARGLDTPAEREFLREVLAGKITLNKDTLLRMAAIRRKAAENQINSWNNVLETGRATDILPTFRGFIPDTPIAIPAPIYVPDEGPGSSQDERVRALLGEG
jgi:hypothetical protein